MKASDSTNSLTGLTEQVELQIEETTCFICLEVMNEKSEPLVDSSLLRTCGCRFKVHPACWNVWMVDKSDFDCPICRKKSMGTGKSPVPPLPAQSEWPREPTSFMRRTVYLFLTLILLTGSIVMIYEIVRS